MMPRAPFIKIRLYVDKLVFCKGEELSESVSTYNPVASGSSAKHNISDAKFVIGLWKEHKLIFVGQCFFQQKHLKLQCRKYFLSNVSFFSSLKKYFSFSNKKGFNGVQIVNGSSIFFLSFFNSFDSFHRKLMKMFKLR